MKNIKKISSAGSKYLADMTSGITVKTVKSSIVITLAVFVFGGIFLLGVFVITANILWAITGTIFLFGANYMVDKGLKGIPSANPPCVGLVTVWGKKTDIVLHEGLKLLAPYFPFLFEVILIDMEKKNEDFIFENVRCHSEKGEGESGGEVTADIGITWLPDEKNLINYINSGGEKGVQDIMRDMLAEDVRQMGREKTWEEMTFATYDLAVRLILKLVGKEGVGEEKDQKPELKTYYTLTSEEKKDPKKMLPILEKLLSSGVTDEHKLGVKFLRLNVKSVEPEGELKKDAEKVAREEQQRKAELYEADTTVEIAKKYKEQLSISSEDAFHGTQVQQGKAKKVIVSGGNALTQAASLLTEGKDN